MIENLSKLGYEYPVKKFEMTLCVYKFNPLKEGSYVQIPCSISATN